MSEDTTSIADLKPDDKNARAHTPRNVGMIVDSLHEVGAARSIVIDEDGVILAGNATIEAAGLAGIEKIKVIEADGETIIAVRRSGLTEEQKRRLSYFDNRTAELADWDAGQLLADLDAGVDLSDMFTEFELEDILGDALAEVETGEAPEAQVDKGAELAEHYGVQVGQIWQLGEHRLAVGDCTDKAVVDAVMRGDKAGAVVTDPPYGINLETNMSDIKTNHRGWRGSGKNYPKVIGDDTPFDPSFLFDCFGYCQEMFFWGADYYCEKLPHRNNGSWIVWDKASNEDGGMLKEGAHSQFELCWSRNKHKRSIIRKMWRGLFGTETQDIRSRVHPTQKPIEVLEWIIAKYTDDGDIIFDGFLGSGGTLIACERLGRKCRAIEIMPEYCAITIQRWVDLTGLEPKLLQ